MKKIFLTFLVFIFLTGQTFATENNDSLLKCSPLLYQNFESACSYNTPDILIKNLQSFYNFVAILGSQENSYETTSKFPDDARFVTPIFTIEEKISPQNLKAFPELKNKVLYPIITGLYFNILKNEKLVNIQKEQITLEKAFLDMTQKGGNLEELKEATETYAQAQSDFLEYKKASQLCKNQLEAFSGLRFNITDLESFDDFDIDTPIKNIAVKAAQNGQITPIQKDLLCRLKYDYKKYQNLCERIEKQEKTSLLPGYFAILDNKDALLELKRKQAKAKLVCIIDYFGLLEALKIQCQN